MSKIPLSYFCFNEIIMFLCWFEQVVIVKLKMDKNRKEIMDRRAKGRLAKLAAGKGKYTEETAMDTSSAAPATTS